MEQKTAELARYFDSRAHEYDSMLEQVRYRIPEWVVARAAELSSAARVLDLGCGNGILGRLLRQTHPQMVVDGVDLSPAMVEAARASGNYREVHQQDIALGLPQAVLDKGSEYDLVLAFGVLEFIENPVPLLRQVHAALRPGGVMWASFEKTEDNSDASGEVRPQLGFRMYHHTQEAVREFLAQADLESTRVESLEAYQRTYDRKQITWWVLDLQRR